MRRFVFSAIVLAALGVGASTATTARADGWPGTLSWGHAAPVVSYHGSPVAVGSVGGPAGPGTVGVQTYPYSYWAAWPGPARGYVGYGASDGFAFYGSPYGHVNDRWSWSSMSGQNTLARYYYPPVR